MGPPTFRLPWPLLFLPLAAGCSALFNLDGYAGSDAAVTDAGHVVTDATDVKEDTKDATDAADTTDTKDANDASDASDATDATVTKRDSGGADGGFNCATADASLCDDFNRTAPIPSGDPRWASLKCESDGGEASLRVDQTLNVTYPQTTNGGSCYLHSKASSALTHAVPSVGYFSLDFDFSYESGSGSDLGPTIFSLGVAPADGSDDQELVQLLIGPDRSAFLFALFQDNNYMTYTLASSPAPQTWLEANTPCHITVEVNVVAPSGKATALCGNTTRTMTSGGALSHPGFAGPATFNFGYYNSSGPSPSWKLTYDNVALTYLAAPPS